MIQNLNSRITILIGTDSTIIELIDEDSSTTFARIKLTPEQLSQALSRLAYTKCECEVAGLDRLGKKMENKKYEFQIGNCDRKNYDELHDLATRSLAENNMSDWEAERYFQAQDSFFTKDKVEYARVVIRRWVDPENKAS
jgi:hypothetical protein